MNVRTLRAFLKASGYSQSELARRVGVSRQAVSLWMRERGAVTLRSEHLLRVAEVLGVSAEDLSRDLPGFGAERDRLRADLLWDRLYPDLDDFALALILGEPRAIARLVEVFGFFASAKTIGERVWRWFPIYGRYVHPARRRQLERLWEWSEHRTAS